MVLVQVSAPVRPTEVPQRVAAAVGAFWPDLDVAVHDDAVRGTGADVAEFRRRVWELRIIDTVRGQLLHGCDGDTTMFRLSKQAALNHRISFPPTPHALGDVGVRLTVQDGDPWADAEALVWWLCPETADGEIVGRTD